MIKPRWKKVGGDLRAAGGRTVMMVVAMAVGIFAVGTIVTAYTILTRDISRNYLGTNPASAQIEVDRVDDALVEAVRLRPGIADAEAGSAVVARFEKRSGEWIPALLFVVRDFHSMRINTFRPESGAWPPSDGSMLLEREALSLAVAKIGDARRLRTSHGITREVTISGTVHDPGLAPAWQEQTLYGYITPSTLEWLGEGRTLHILKVMVNNQPMGETSIEKTVGDLARWMRGQGYHVGEIRIPPPGRHPHQSQMTAILALLLIFSLLALILSSILTATIIGGMLAQQVRQIGVMKVTGATTQQIVGLYLVLVSLIGAAALIIGLPSGTAAGRGFARVVARLLNFTLYSEAVPWWIYGALLLIGILTPCIAALVPILAVARTTVRQAITDYGISRRTSDTNMLVTIIGKIRGIDRTLILALRNTFRRKGRLVLTMGLLAAAGGMFLTSLNMKTAWERYIRDAASNRRYDFEVRMSRAVPEKKIIETISRIPEVQDVETWNMAPAAVYRPDGLDVAKTYPDKGHYSFMMRAAPPGSKMVRSPMISGRWLRQGDIDSVVLNHFALVFYPNIKAGDSIVLAVGGHPVTLKVVGITRQILTPATAYVHPDTFAKVCGLVGESNTIRVALKNHDLDSAHIIGKEIERVLEKENIGVNTIISEKLLDRAQSGHVYIFIFALLFMAGVMAVVGALGLMTAMGANVTERTREFGVMRAIGAKTGTVMRNVILEGLFIGVQSWVVAVVLSLPLSLGVGRLLGNLAFRSPLPLIMSSPAILIWLMIIVVGSFAASAYPAWRASQLSVRETLTYE